MFARMTGFAVLVVAGWVGSVLAIDPPETTVQFDLQWLSPPKIAPEGGQAMARQMPDYTRLQGVANVGGSFTWPLRYGVEVRRYPILTLRYRARDLAVGPTYANRIMDLQLVDSGGRMNSLTVINYEDLIQDGTLHEIRKDLSQLPADAFIDQMRFNFQGGPIGGRLDIYSITLDRGPNSPEPAKFEQRQVEFVVKDAAGNAVADAEVHLGLLERSNWVALGSTDGAGRISLATLVQLQPDGTIMPIEAVVEHEGNLPQYVAPINLPATSPVEVKLAAPAPAQSQPQAQVAPAQPVEPAPGVYPSEPVYYNGPVYVPYPVYTYGYSYYGTYPGNWWVPTYCVRYRSNTWCDRDDRWREHHGDRADVRWYDHPRRETPPPTHRPPPVRVPPPERMEHGPGPVQIDSGRANDRRPPNVDRNRNPGPIAQDPPDARNRGDKGHPILANEPVVGPGPKKVATPPQGRDNGRGDKRDDRMTPPQRVEAGPTRDDKPQRPAPNVIRTPDKPDRGNAAKGAPDPVQVPERRDPPARVQRDNQTKINPTERRVDPPARTVKDDAPARVQRPDDGGSRQAQRDDTAQRAAAEAQRAESRRDAVQRETAQRDQTVRRVDAPRVAETPPPTVSRDNNTSRRGGAQTDGNSSDPNAGNAAPARSSRR